MEEGEILDHDQEFCSEDEEMELKSSLPIASFNASFTMDSIPMTGEEYLCQVRHQRISLPKVSSSPSSMLPPQAIHSLIPSSFSASSIAKTRKGLLPSKEWQDAMIAAFMQERESWSHHSNVDAHPEIPSINDEAAWQQLLSPQTLPTPSIISHLTHPAKLRLILYHSRWTLPSGPSKHQFLWMQSLMANIELGLGSADLSILRSLAKQFIEIRASIQDPVDWDLVSRLNAIIVIVGRVYEQSDLL